MAVPYSNTKLRVPKGFQNILEGLAREILRNQPENIFEFGNKYFEQLMRVREETGHDPAVHGAKLEDRFYNNDSFKSPSVDSGDPQQQEAALKIQTEYRRHAAEQEVEELKEEDAALKIQAGFRGYQDRQKVIEMRESSAGKKQEEEEVDIDLTDPDVEQAAIKIQAGFKGYKARQDLKETKKEETSPTKTEDEEEVDIDLDDPEVSAAALKIQAGFRGHKTRQEITAKRKETQEVEGEGTQEEQEVPQATETQEETVEEQKSEVKEEAKVEAQEEEIDIDLTDPEVEKAAEKIQAGFKGFKARKEVKAKKETVTEKDVEVKQEEATVEAQEEEVDIDLTDPEVEKAAEKIQAGFKGFKARKEVKAMKDQGEQSAPQEPEKEKTKEEEEIDIDLEDPETEKAAIKIQAGFKGYKTRKEMKDKKEGESEAPAESGDQKEESGDQKADQSEEVDIDLTDPEVEKAATKIQAGFKGFKARQEIKEKKEQKSGQATPQGETQQEGGQEETKAEEQETKAEEPAQQEAGQEKAEEAIIKLPQDKAQKILETLSAFKSFKKPTTLPDRLRLTKKNILSVRRWTAMAKRKVRKGTFSSMQSLIGYFPQIEKVTEVEKEDTRLSEMKEETVQSETAQSEMAREDTTVSQGEKQESLPEVQLTQDIPTFNFNAFDDLYAESDSDWASSSDEEDFDISRDLQTEMAPKVKRMADGMGGVMTEIASEMIPITDKMITKEKSYGPYKAGLLAMEQWVEKNRERFTPDELGRREKQLECYQNIVKIYESMEDDEPEELNKAHNTELRRLMQEIQKCGQLPYEVQSVQDIEAQKTFNAEDMADIFTPMIGNIGQAFAKMIGSMDSIFDGQDGNTFEVDSSDEEDGGGGGNCTIL